VINQRVQIQLNVEAETDQAATGEPSRVEDVIVVTGKKPVRDVLFAPPRDNGDVEVPRQGHPMAIVWSTDRGVLELPVQFMDVQRVSEVVSAWRVRVTGPAARVQRRHFVRVPYVTPVILTFVEPLVEPVGEIPAQRAEEPAAVPGPATAPVGAAAAALARPAAPARPVAPAGLPRPATQAGPAGPAAAAGPGIPSPVAGATADLSEGGLRCVIDRELPPDTRVIAGFTFGEDDFRLEARVVRSFPYTDRSGRGEPPRWDTGVRFVNPDLSGDVLRKNVFAEQMRVRRGNGR
jgi:hypothetical protein